MACARRARTRCSGADVLPCQAVWDGLMLVNDWWPTGRASRIKHLRTHGYAFEPAKQIVLFYEHMTEGTNQ